jgi:hypothetical protein
VANTLTQSRNECIIQGIVHGSDKYNSRHWKLSLSKRGIAIVLQSPLAGMAYSLPAPLQRDGLLCQRQSLLHGLQLLQSNAGVVRIANCERSKQSAVKMKVWDAPGPTTIASGFASRPFHKVAEHGKLACPLRHH